MQDINDLEKGLEVTFTFIEGARFKGENIKKTLVKILKEAHAHGYSIRSDFEGVDYKNHLHSARFFELADNPVEITTVGTNVIIESIVEKVKTMELPVFCVVKEAAFINLHT